VGEDADDDIVVNGVYIPDGVSPDCSNSLCTDFVAELKLLSTVSYLLLLDSDERVLKFAYFSIPIESFHRLPRISSTRSRRVGSFGFRTSIPTCRFIYCPFCGLSISSLVKVTKRMAHIRQRRGCEVCAWRRWESLQTGGDEVLQEEQDRAHVEERLLHPMSLLEWSLSLVESLLVWLIVLNKIWDAIIGITCLAM